MRARRHTLFALLAMAGAVCAENAARPGKLIEELPTLECLGVRWLIAGDDNGNARIGVEYRKAGQRDWRQALDLFRVDSRGIRSATRPPAGHTLHAGSTFYLHQGTDYEVRLSLKDPDGGDAQRVVRMTTWTEPTLPEDGRVIDVRPPDLKDALAKAKPGDTLRLHKGVYRGTFRPRSGSPGKPIALVGAGDGPAILDGEGKSNVINAPGLRHVMFEGLTFQNARWAIAVNGGAHVTVRRCVIRDVDYGFVAQHHGGRQQRILIADNLFVGRSTWPRTRGIEDRRGIQLGGTGHVVCHNRIRGFADAIDTFPAYPVAAVDFYRNDISECTDDGIEMDYSDHNTRCFENRLTNVFQGISVQPIHGGPIYIFRNALFNVGLETFKMHNRPSGALFFHNTSVKAGMPLVLYTGETVSNCLSRNNLFIGTSGNYAFESTAPMRGCDFDHDGFGGTWKQFLKWDRARYPTMAAARQRAPVYRHVVRVAPATLFRAGRRPPTDPKKQFAIAANDLRLKAGSDAIDKGVVLPNINDVHAGEAPDLGAHELGGPLPHYGPRPPKP